MANSWLQKSKLQYQFHEPVLLTITFFVPQTDKQEPVGLNLFSKFGKKVKKYIYFVILKKRIPVHYYMYDFDETGLDFFDFNIMNCADGIPRKQLSFNLPSK